VASMVALFRRHKAEIVREEGERREEASERVMRVVDDKVQLLLMQMLCPEKVGLRWVEV